MLRLISLICVTAIICGLFVSCGKENGELPKNEKINESSGDNNDDVKVDVNIDIGDNTISDDDDKIDAILHTDDDYSVLINRYINSLLDVDGQISENIESSGNVLEVKKNIDITIHNLQECIYITDMIISEALAERTEATDEGLKQKYLSLSDQATILRNAYREDLNALASKSVAYYKELQVNDSQELVNTIISKETQLDDYLEEPKVNMDEYYYADGAYQHPTGAGKGYISCRYGGTDILGRPHYAYDIALGMGELVCSVNNGLVVVASYNESLGYYIVIDHGNGITSVYAHLSYRIVKVGNTVKKGQTIGLVGSSGLAVGNQIHFEIRKDGIKVNPAIYIKF